MEVERANYSPHEEIEVLKNQLELHIDMTSQAQEDAPFDYRKVRALRKILLEPKCPPILFSMCLSIASAGFVTGRPWWPGALQKANYLVSVYTNIGKVL